MIGDDLNYIGVILIMPYKLSIKQKIDLVKLYKNGTSIKELSVLYNITMSAVTGLLKTRKIPIRKQVIYRKNYFDEYIFDKIDTEEKAYWLGFILGDGCVTDSGLSVGLATKDIDHLIKLQSFFKSKNKICKSKSSNSHYIVFYSQKLVNSLNKYGVVKNKTYTEIQTPFQIPKKLLRHFYRGLFDADGWIYLHQSNNGYKKYKQYGFGICSYNKTIIIEIKDWVNKKLKYECGYFRHRIRKSGNGFELNFCGNIIYKDLYKLLYTDINIYLERKYKIANEFYDKLSI